MAEAIAPGVEIDGFRVGACLHDGGMGMVFEVESARADFPLLMKVPRLGRGQPTEGIVGFETEVMILSAIQTPHAPRFVAAGDLARVPYLVEERIEGENLEVRVRRGRMSASEAAQIGAALADAVESLHRQDTIHLDIKPGNVMIRPDGRAVLIDFGLARHARLPDLLAEEMRKAVGTAEYISPEQVIGVRSDHRSDLFAIGVVLYELVTGELPFGAPQSVSGLRDRLWLEPRPPRALAPDCPAWLQEVILRCIDPRPERRYPSAAQLAFALRHPDQIQLTQRGEKTRRAGLLTHLGRWFRAAGREAELTPPPAEQSAAAPIVLAAVDTEHLDDALQKTLQATTARILAHAPNARLACVAVLESTPLMDGEGPLESASHLHREHLVRLRHWAEPMQLPVERLSLHVIEGGSPAKVLVEYARANQVTLLLIGAANHSEPRLGLGRSITTQVAEEAPCSVYVVRSSTGVIGGTGPG